MTATTLSGLHFQLRYAEYQKAANPKQADFYQSEIEKYKQAILKLTQHERKI